MKITGLLVISLWSLCWAHPVSRYPGAHHSNSKEHWSISVEEGLNKRADSTDLSDEDAENRLSSSTEDRRRDLGGNSCESCESNSFPREVSSRSLESFSEDDHQWSTQDNEEGAYFGHQMVYRKRAGNKDSNYHRKEINKESSDDESAGRTSLEDQSEGHLFGPNKISKEQFDVENDGMVYTPEQVLYTFVERGGSDLTAEEDISGDDSLDGNNDEDPGYTKSPSEVDALQPPATHGEQDGGHTRGRHSDDSSSSSSSSSESRNLEKEDNHIIDYGRRHGRDSYSSSQEDGYDFQSEEMQGDEPRTFESHGSDSHMLPEAIHSKESSQETHSSSKTVEHFERKPIHYVDGDSDEDNSPEYEQNKALKEDDDNSEADSQLVEDISQSTENVPSQSREDETSHSGKSIESSSREQSRENLNSHSTEDMHSQSQGDDKHSRSREHDKHSRSREDGKNSQSTEDDKHSWSQEDATRGHSQSQSKENTSSHSREDKHSQSRKDDVHSQSIELSSQSGENEDTASEEDVKSDSIEDTRSSQEKVVQKSKETEEESNERNPSKSQESHSVEKSGNMPPRAAESREFKWHHSRSSEKSSSMEESEESAEDTKESVEDDSRLSQSASSESSKVSEESASSDDSNSNEGQDQQSSSSETSESKEEVSNSIERPSKSREDTMSQSDSMEDSSWSRSKELESRKLMLDFYHNKPFSDYDDNDCQDGY
ncbi:dentin matrix acidic phosphoprotein 1 [Pantherophis guttatus]|uniref:Dentin matrix acidic phosphoprotein 1 n=1 Tax=Pantherophis guttatus TaxID=94885 RepID=A0A6P9DUW2_PANGU|nr:dentin matrix acidic phosphoprotein 1 [Pantherophis guttatus]